ncbi:MAG: hypothetical protein A2603_09375 [Bdellovibrionales bacterium RIFOXYD1_FULL_55_31]|nr:MAG: hypothetical protein A2603_09375 [Bdellovibrionales bacterium RIFOXYD1_FULL_55_31]
MKKLKVMKPGTMRLVLVVGVFGAICSVFAVQSLELFGKHPGFEIESLRTTSAGYMLDLRYRITSPRLAKKFLNRKVGTYLLEPRTGARLNVPTSPKIGALRQTSAVLKAGKTYFTFFANPGRFIKPGQHVTVVLGDLRFENLRVD